MDDPDNNRRKAISDASEGRLVHRINASHCVYPFDK